MMPPYMCLALMLLLASMGCGQKCLKTERIAWIWKPFAAEFAHGRRSAAMEGSHKLEKFAAPSPTPTRYQTALPSLRLPLQKNVSYFGPDMSAAVAV